MWPKNGSSLFRNEFFRLLSGRVIWPNFPKSGEFNRLEQQTVPNVLRPKRIAKMSELPQDTLMVALTVGSHVSGFVSICNGQSLVFFRMIQSPKVSFLQQDLAILIV